MKGIYNAIYKFCCVKKTAKSLALSFKYRIFAT